MSREQRPTVREFSLVAYVYDRFYELHANWDEDCRRRSSTGENMVRENMDHDEYFAFRDSLMDRACKQFDVDIELVRKVDRWL